MRTSNDTRSDCPTRIGFDDAQACAVALAGARALGAERIAIKDARGRVAAEDVRAPHDLPSFANSAMDGFAVRAGDLRGDGQATTLQLAGTTLAGSTTPIECAPGTCVRITTGAPIPAGADTVVVKENTFVDGDTVTIRRAERQGSNVRPAGEDCRRGDIAMRRGEYVSPARLGVLAACGKTHVAVARLPRVSVLVTGDELVPPGRELGHGQIHDSNRYMLGALLGELGIVMPRCLHMRDEPAALKDALRSAAADSDIVISSGGVSAGEADFLPRLIAELGHLHFWKVRLRPGMPVLCGEVDRALVFALPGNPVSTFATFLAFVVPAARAMQGASDALPVRSRARLAGDIVKNHDRTELLRATIESRDDGALWLTPLARQGSGMLCGVAESDVLIVVDENTRSLTRGSVVEFIPLSPATWGVR